MIELQDISDFYEPYPYNYLYPTSYRIRGLGYLPGYENDGYKPHNYRCLLRSRSISYKPHKRSSLTRSQDSVCEPRKHSVLATVGRRRYGPCDYNYRFGSSCYEPRGYSYLSGAGTGYYEPCVDNYHSSSEPCGFNPIPIGRSGYAYRRRYSCRPISGDPNCYGSRTYYPPSYWMEQNRYYGPC